MVLCEGRFGRGSPSYLDIEGGSQGSSHSFRRGYGFASKAPQLVDFDDMLMDRPSLFTRMAITTKTKPRELLVSEAVSSSPPTIGMALPTPSINPLLKRMASDAPTDSQPSKRAKKYSLVQKKRTQVLVRDSSGEGS
ncbi:hypothetical protein LIER_21958 [Lithospermum erythrorhizon]|uniref:Uncharacterized protein n=1 Tax=Lithospermum erythrorhizon TaxID=34254 RepID=A0AAV3QUE5_LITER